MRTPKKFQRTREDFTCGQCGSFVRGNGYTNHCPECLWSKHVDIHPGDRQSPCLGLMKPVGVEFNKGKYNILHSCISCGLEKRNKVSEKDNFHKIVQLSGINE